MTVVDRFVQAVSHGGAMKKPTLIVIHSAETPLKAGYAKSIAENWFGKSATTSAHMMVGPDECIRMLSDNVVSYAVGPKANGFTLNIEQAGYARLTRAEWTTADGLKQHGKVGALVRELSEARGIPLRWATDAQIKAAASGTPGGVCFHDDIRRVLGGTSHSDPTPYYPRDLLEQAWNGTTQEDDMFDDTDRKDLRDLKSIVTWALSPENGFNSQGEDTKRIRDIHATVAALAARDPKVTIDASAIAAAIPDDLARQVADELGKRLATS